MDFVEESLKRNADYAESRSRYREENPSPYAIGVGVRGPKANRKLMTSVGIRHEQIEKLSK